MGKPGQGSAAAEGARRATGDAAGRGRVSARRKRETVLRLLRGEDLESVSRELGITAARASQWRDQFSGRRPGQLEEPGAGCPGRRQSSAAGQDRRTADGERATVREGRPVGGGRPFGPTEVEAMKGAHSISTRRAYGVQRVCRVWHCARSSVYARRQATTSPTPCRRRGPVGAAPDDVLVGHIRRVLEASPFHGEGYRKAWAKLRVAGIRTAPERVRRLMREHDLQAPHRVGQAHGPKAQRRHDHDGDPRCDVGHGHDGHGDRGRGDGLRLRGRRSLHSRVHRSPCGQARHPFRGPRADSPGRPRTLRCDRQRRRPRAASASRPRVELSRGRLSTGGGVLRHREFRRVSCGSPKATGSRSASSAR